jgi:hypothetical protein
MLGRDLTNPKSIHAKGVMFLILGLLAAGMIIAESWNWKVVALLAICVWAFCRAYYYAFYVIEKYVDPTYRFDGLISFVRYWMRKKEF